MGNYYKKIRFEKKNIEIKYELGYKWLKIDIYIYIKYYN